MAPPAYPNVPLIKVNGLVLPPDLGRDGEWRLARRSLPVIAGREHNYLELTYLPANGGPSELVGEIHGVSHDREKDTYGAVAVGTSTDLVGTRTKDGHWGKPPTDKNIELVRGNFDNVVGRYWKDAMDKTDAFNNKQPTRVYKYDDQNSNTFARSLIRAIGLEPQSGRWDNDVADYAADGFSYNPKQWNVRDVFDPKQAVMRDAGEGYRNLDDVMRQGLEAGQQKP
jgi:hypothetical protein